MRTPASALRWTAASAGLLLAVVSVSHAGLVLGPEEIVQSGGTDIVVVGYSVPSFVDWNNDGLGDLVVGEGGTTAKARVYLNEGTASDPQFSDFTYVQSLGADLVETGSG